LAGAIVVVRRGVVVYGFELPSELFLTLSGSFDFCPLSGQLRLLLLSVRHCGLLLALLLTLL
jgi:hypothetical protein